MFNDVLQDVANMPDIKLPILVFIAYSVSQRTREIGIRIALGAESRMIRQMILREAAWLSGIGIALGFVGRRTCDQFPAETPLRGQPVGRDHVGRHRHAFKAKTGATST